MKFVADILVANLVILTIYFISMKLQNIPVVGQNNISDSSQTTQNNVHDSPLVAPDDYTNKSKSTLVYKTKYSNKIHLPDCQYVKNKSNTVSLDYEEALNAELESCKVCKPDKWFSLSN